MGSETETIAANRIAHGDDEALNEIARTLVAELDLDKLVQKVTDVATALNGAKFGAFFYNTVNEDGESYMLYTLSGAPREKFEKFGLPRNTPVFNPTFRGDAVLRSADITKDPRYGTMAPHFGMPKGHLPVRSYLAVPVVARSGNVIGGLFFGHPEPNVFTARSETITVGLAAQAAIAMDNARLYREAQQEIAQRKRVEGALRESEERLRGADRHMTEFVATLAHELRNPLGSVSNAVSILKLKPDDADVVRNATEILQRQIQQLNCLVDDLLDVSRIRRGKIELRRERTELASIVRNAVEAIRPLAQKKHHELSVSIGTGTSLVADVDPARLTQVVVNLLNNACKFTPEGGHIDLALERADGKILIRVRDNGIGIAADQLTNIFEMYTQANTSIQDPVGGLGIGLALVKRLTAMHGGDIEASSAGLNQGSEFVLRLPAAA